MVGRLKMMEFEIDERDIQRRKIFLSEISSLKKELEEIQKKYIIREIK